MASLTGTKIKDTYDSLLKVSDNGALGASAKRITDGVGNNSPIYVSTSGVGVGGSPTNAFDVIGESTVGNGTYGVKFSYSAGNTSGVIDTANSANALEFRTSGTERMRIDSSGNINLKGAATGIQYILTDGTSTGNTGQINIAAGAGSSDFGSGIVLYGRNHASYAGSLYLGASQTTGDIIFGRGQTGLGTELMRIDSSGNVGINTDSPLAKFEVKGNARITRPTDSATYLEIQVADVSAKYLGYDTDGYMSHSFYSNGTEHMRITGGGDVFIGTQVNPSNGSGGTVFLKDSGNRNFLKLSTSTTVSIGLIEFDNPNGIVGKISTSGSSTIYATSSDYRLKEDWQPMANALDRVDSLKPVNFAWKADGSRVDGFLAHELQEVIPEAVTGEKDAMRDEEYEVSPAVYEEVLHPAEEAVYETIEHPAIAEELDEEGNIIVEAQEAYTEEVLVSEAKEEWTEQVLVSEAVIGTRSVPDYQGIDQSKIVPLLVAAIQELKAEIDALKGA